MGRNNYYVEHYIEDQKRRYRVSLSTGEPNIVTIYCILHNHGDIREFTLTTRINNRADVDFASIVTIHKAILEGKGVGYIANLLGYNRFVASELAHAFNKIRFDVNLKQYDKWTCHA